MTSDELHDAGRLLYGERWQAMLARALGVSDRSVRRWASGAATVPPAAAVAIQGLVENAKRRPHGRRLSPWAL